MRISAFLFLVLFTSSFLLSCGVEVDYQFSPALKAPVAATDTGFSLSSTEGTFTFSGSGLFIDPDANVDDVRTVLEASVNSRLAKAKIFEISRGVMPQLKSKIDALKAEVGSLKNPKSTPVMKSGFMRQSVRWYENYLELADGDLGKQKSERFSKYCEALIWKYALDKDLVASRFTQMPVPSLACGGVYKKLGLFKTVCQSATQNYFECFWSNAVTKTSFFKSYSEEQQSLILSLVESGELLEFAKKRLQRTKLAAVFAAQKKMSSSLARKLAKKSHDKNVMRKVFQIKDVSSDYLTPKDLLEEVLFEDYLFVEDYPEDYKQKIMSDLELLAPAGDRHSLTDRYYNQPLGSQKQTNSQPLQ